MTYPFRFVLILVSLLVAAGLFLPSHTPTSISPASVQAQDNAVPRFETAQCPRDGDRTIPGNAQCGYLTVLENRSDPNSRTIRLPVYIFPARSNQNRQTDAILYLAGGPGGDDFGTAVYFSYTLGRYNQDRDVVLIDQRGTGFAEPSLKCPAYGLASYESYADNDYTLETGARHAADTLLECAQQFRDQGVDLSAYNSAENAADMADLLQVLGYSAWNVYGISYGSRLTMTVLRDHPDIVRSIIIDGVFPPEADLYPETPLNGYKALEGLFASCAADPRCNTAYPDLEEIFYATVEDLNANPYTVQLYRYEEEKFYPATLDGDLFFGALFYNLYSTRAIETMPYAIYMTHNGHVEYLVQNYLDSFFTWDGIATVMHYAVNCSEEIIFNTREELEAFTEGLHPSVSYFGNMDNLVTWYICEGWNAPSPNPIEDAPIISDKPALVIAGELDPVTPPHWAELAAAQLSNSYYYLVPGGGHGISFSSDCVQSIIEQFLNDPTQEPDSFCLSFQRGPSFEIRVVPD